MSKENKISFIEEIKKLLQSAKERAVAAINVAMFTPITRLEKE